MAYLSDDDFRELLGMKPVANGPRLFDRNRCTCGGMVGSHGQCYRCHTDHSEAVKAEQRRRQAQAQKHQLTAEEFQARLARLKGQSCHSCFHGQLDEHGHCDFCEYHYTDYHDIV